MMEQRTDRFRKLMRRRALPDGWGKAAAIASFISLASAGPIHAKLNCPAPSAATITKSIPLKDTPNYFLRASRSTREVSFASGGGEPNLILNIDSGRLTSAPGSIDPVLSGDGKILSVPQSAVQTKGSLQVASTTPDDYDYRIVMGEIQDKSGTAIKADLDQLRKQDKEILFDDALVFYNRDASGKLTTGFIEPDAGNYQTMGVVRSSEQESVYRVLVGRGMKLMTRDLRRDSASGAITPASTFRPACQNISSGVLPILAPDGRAFSFYDVEAGDTKVMTFNDHGGCDQVDSIPALIGKPDFSPDGRYLAFHVDQKFKAKNVTFSAPDKEQKLGIYLYDRESKVLTLLHDDAGTNSYYPVFMNNQEIAFIEGSGDPEHPKMAIRLLKVEGRAGFHCRGCHETRELRKASGLLGAIYGEKCGMPALHGGNSLVALAQLSPDDCRALVKDLSPEDLEKAQTAFDARVDWDIGANKEMMTAINQPVQTRAAPPVAKVKDLAAICERIEARAVSDAPTAAK